MAGYGADLTVDWKAVEALPTGKDKESTQKRRKMFCSTDMNGNGILSLAECDRLIVSVLRVQGLSIMKPVINRAFHAARDIVPPVGDFNSSYVDFNEFRYFLIYLKHYLNLFILYDSLDQKSAGGGKYSDRRLSFKEFKKGIPKLIKWGVKSELADRLKEDPESVWKEIDCDGGGLVLFDEFAHWALWSLLFEMDNDDDGLEEALAVLSKQKPNLCGKDLKSIKAHKAKYRVDAPISGQGCLRGDASFAGGREEVPKDGGKELAAGRHYPGSLKAWQASLQRCTKAEEESKKGPKICKCGCNRPAFGRFDTCCTHCKGPDGPHAKDCLGKGYPKCENGCGRLQFGRFTTCCTHCKGPDGPHARDCFEKMEKVQARGDGDNSAKESNSAADGAEAQETITTIAQTKEQETITATAQTKEVIKKLFRHADANRDGFLSIQEIQNAFSQLGMSSAKFQKLFKAADKNNDGKLSTDEFIDWIFNVSGNDEEEVGNIAADVLGSSSNNDEKVLGGGCNDESSRRCSNGCGRRPFRQYDTCCKRCTGPEGPHAKACDDHAEDAA